MGWVVKHELILALDFEPGCSGAMNLVDATSGDGW
jgi:hypothetical protein